MNCYCEFETHPTRGHGMILRTKSHSKSYQNTGNRSTPLLTIETNWRREEQTARRYPRKSKAFMTDQPIPYDRQRFGEHLKNVIEATEGGLGR